MKNEDRVNNLLEEFDKFKEWTEKYSYIIDMGKALPVMDEEHKIDKYLISGCQSKVWLFAEYTDGKVKFSADSNTIITKGIISMLIETLSDNTPDFIINAKLDFIDKIGLKEHLSPTRSNGLISMIKQMKLYALVFKTKYES